MFYYQHNIGDYCKSTVHLTLLEHGVYRRLMDVYYDTETPLTASIEDLCRKICARSEDERKATETVLKEFFTLTENGWESDRCNAEIATYKGQIEKARIAGKASAAKRKVNACSTGDQQEVNGRSTGVQRALDSGSTNQETGTNKQEPENKNKSKEDSLFGDEGEDEDKTRFRKPTMEQVEDFAVESGATRSDGQIMWDHWEAGGWKRGNQQIKNWKSAFKAWQRQGWLPSQKQAALDKPKINWRNTL